MLLCTLLCAAPRGLFSRPSGRNSPCRWLEGSRCSHGEGGHQESRAAARDRHGWGQSLQAPVAKPARGPQHWPCLTSWTRHSFPLQSAAGFSEMAAPTSSYEKTRPLEAGETAGCLGLLGSCGPHGPTLRHHSGMCWVGCGNPQPVLKGRSRRQDCKSRREGQRSGFLPDACGGREPLGRLDQWSSPQAPPAAPAACGHALKTWLGQQRRRAEGRQRRSG